VGDLGFQRKCLDQIARFKAAGCAVVLASHDMMLIRELCDQALWLRAGCLVAHGPPDVVTRQYESEMATETRRRTPEARPPVPTRHGTQLRVNENRFGSLEIEVVDVRLHDASGHVVSAVDSGESLTVVIDYVCHADIRTAIFGVTITREDDVVCFDTSTAQLGVAPSGPGHRRQIALEIEHLDLSGGTFYVDVGAYERTWAYAFDYHWHVYPLFIRAPASDRGVVRLKHRWQMKAPP
jgi:lipopolysaccharide transport system ATP-binding protein